MFGNIFLQRAIGSNLCLLKAVAAADVLQPTTPSAINFGLFLGGCFYQISQMYSVNYKNNQSYTILKKYVYTIKYHFGVSV